MPRPSIDAARRYLASLLPPPATPSTTTTTTSSSAGGGGRGHTSRNPAAFAPAPLPAVFAMPMEALGASTGNGHRGGGVRRQGNSAHPLKTSPYVLGAEGSEEENEQDDEEFGRQRERTRLSGEEMEECDADGRTSVGTSVFDEDAGGYTPYLGRLTAVACLGGLQFGWDTGIAAGMLVAIHQDLGHTLSATEQEVIVSATTAGAIVGALTAGRLSDWMGRKKVMIASGIFFALGSIEQAASQVVRELVLGRVLVGLGVGMASMVVPTYLAECAPPSIRGRIVSINSLLITGGQVVAYLVDAAFYNLPHGWRWMVLAGGLPALVQLVGLFYLDESPRWLVAQGRHTSARHVLSRIYPLATPEAITHQIVRIEESVSGIKRRAYLPSPAAVGAEDAADKSEGFGEQLRKIWRERGSRKALLLACGLQACQQLVGANSILYYSSRLLLMAGFKTNPNVAAIWIAIANFAGTAIALRLIDRVGRRTLLLRATAGATVALACLALALGQIDTGEVTDSATPIGVEHPPPGAWTYICLLAMIGFLFTYALGLGIVPWLIQSEIFSGSVRGIGGGLATATNWSVNLVSSATFLDLVRLITPAGCFWFYSCVGAITWLFAYTQLPELAGVSINDVQAALEGSFPSGQGANGSTAYEPLSRQSRDDGRRSTDSVGNDGVHVRGENDVNNPAA